MSTNASGVPDLLRRFTPMSHCLSLTVRGFHVSLQTNDAELAAAMKRAGEAQTDDSQRRPLLMSLIRDGDAPPGSAQVTLLAPWPLVTLLLGTGTVLTLDCERRELIGFLAPAVPAERVIDDLLPLLLDHVP